ncbi:MAG: nucleotidyltransferase family protein, partial [Vicinamibacteria bacterium]
MIIAAQTSSMLQHTYWLAVRGTQQLDLAERFATAADEAGFKVLALKGISIAQELYGVIENRPMADVDFLVVDTHRFAEVADVARTLDLTEIGASDHALVFKEPRSGVVLELHISLTACPGLFPIDHGGLWERRKTVVGAKFQRLSDADLLIHLSLHTAFQHG